MHKYLINPNMKLSKINKDIYGHFSEHLGRCIYEGVYVGESSEIPNVKGMRCDVVNALREMKIPVLRWPGGCFADEYHWRDGIGDKAERKKMINTHWGGVVEDNSFGTHEFLELCEQLGCDAYISGNLGSGTVAEMSEWVEYMTFGGLSPMSELRKKNGRERPWKLKYFGIGNENWGCGGHMLPEFYADNFRQYETYVRDYDNEHILRIACGASGDDYNCSQVLMKKACSRLDSLSLHYYTVPGSWEKKGSATVFGEDEYHLTLGKAWHIDEIITRHSEIMNRFDPQKRVSLTVDEWGTWFDVEEGTNPGFLYQQNTMRDAMVAAYSLNIFNKHSDRVRMANIAQLANVLQAVVLTDGADCVLTPTYFIFKMFAGHQENTLLGSYITTEKAGCGSYTYPDISESASVDENGVIFSTIANSSITQPTEIACQIADFTVGSVKAEILAKCDAFNDFEKKDSVKATEFTGFEVTKDGFRAVLPPCSVVRFEIA